MLIKYFPTETKTVILSIFWLSGKEDLHCLKHALLKIHAWKDYWQENQAGTTNIIKITMQLKEQLHLWVTSESFNYSLHIMFDSYQNHMGTSYETQAITEIL